MPAQRTDELAELEQVKSRRFDEAHAAGLTLLEAHAFADSGSDIGVLRKLVLAGCPPETIRRIVL
jgi:hypothetical protein